MNCVRCDRIFHTCPNCGLLGAEWDYCCENCYTEDGSPDYTYYGEPFRDLDPDDAQHYLENEEIYGFGGCK
jgi:hypothetical protein